MAIKIEENEARWVDVWVGIGTISNGVFSEHRDPVTGVKIAPLHFHLEDGCHPLAPSTALRKCPSCSKWFALEQMCDVCEHEETEPYDGHARAIGYATSGLDIRTEIATALYGFLLAEQVPDPVTWEVGKLLDAEGV